MSDATAPTRRTPEPADFDALRGTLRDAGPDATLERLVRHLDDRGAYRALLDALLLKARHELGLPLVHVGALSEVAEPIRSRYEERYVAAIRAVGRKFLDAGEIATAWPYFRAIGEPEPVARAIDDYRPQANDERLAAIIEVALHHGANPRRGFELMLEHHGSCPAITAFEQLPRDDATREACAGALVRQIHEHLTASLRADIAERGHEKLPEGLSIPELIAGRDWLFAEDNYHIDISHLASTVRVAPLLTDRATIALAVELTDYGRRLSPRHVYEGDPPFENTYEDHAVYLRALLGEGVDEAAAHFAARLPPPPGSENDAEGSHDPMPAQVLVGLLARTGRLDAAIEIAAAHLAGYPESALFCPGLTQLCQRAGRPDLLARIAREHDDLVNFTAAIIQAGMP